MELLERQGSLESLAAELASSRKSGRIVVVSGDAGIGKTSLVRAFVEASGTEAAVGRCDDTSVPTPLGPFRDIYRMADTELPTTAPDAAQASIAGVLSRFGIVLVEDIHWADEASLDLLAHIGRRIGDHQSLIVLTHRPAADSRVVRCLAQLPPDATINVELAPLSRAAVLALAESAGRDGEAIYTNSGGNPFLVSELLAAPPGEIPPKVSTSTLARLSQLSPGAHDLSELIAVFPSGAGWDALADLRPGCDGSLDELEEQRWLDSRSECIVFRHELIRQAIVESLPAARRRALNREIVDWLIDHHGEPGPIAHHASEAGDDQKSIDYAVIAALQLSRAGAHHDALTHLERVSHLAELLSANERAQFAEALGMEQMAGDQTDEAVHSLEDAIERWSELGDLDAVARVLANISSAVWRIGRPEESIALARRALTVLDGTEHVERRFRARVSLAQSIGMMSRWPEAIIEIGNAIAEWDGVPPTARAMALALRADGRRILGEERGALADYRNALGLLDADAHDERGAVLRNRVATSLAVLDLHAAEGHFEAMRAGSANLQSIYADRTEIELECGIEFLRGDWDEAISSALSLIDDPLAMRVRPGLVAGLIRVRRGDPSGLALLEQARDRASNLADIQRLGSIAVAFCELYWLGIAQDLDTIASTARLAHHSGHARYSGELAVWCRRLGLPEVGDPSPLAPRGFLLELAGDRAGAAAFWSDRGIPYQRILALGFSDDARAIQDAIDAANGLAAGATADRLRARLRELGHGSRRGRSRSTLANPGGLTRRQTEVIALLADQLTNQQIADRLYISPKTVDHHVSAILRALGVAGRHEAAVWARDQGLA